MEGTEYELKPDFFGFWNHSRLTDSIFFMFLGEKGEKIHGTIEDKFGRALFEGTKTEKEIIFDKKYMESSDPMAAHVPLKYQGKKINDSDNFYEGTYSDSSANLTGTFVLFPFPKNSPTMFANYEDFHRRIFLR